MSAIGGEPNFRHAVRVPRNRLLLLAGAAALAAVVVIVAVVLGSGGSGSSTPTVTTSSGGSSGPEAATIFKGIPQQGDTLGKASAPAVLTVYEDPQCPFCRQWDIDTLPTVVAQYVRTGRIQLRYRGIPIISENSLAGLAAIYAAGRQNKLWNLAVALYERQGAEGSGWITIPVIRDAAAEVGVNATKLLKDADSKTVSAEVTASAKDASSKKIDSTPTFVLQKTLGTPEQLNVSGLEPDQFTPSLDAALQ
jgi:protein-disulfide isomerase